MTDRDDARSLPPDEVARRVHRPPAPSSPAWPPPPAVPPERYAAPHPGAGYAPPGWRERPAPPGSSSGSGRAPPRSWDDRAGPGSSWGGGQVPPAYGQAPPGYGQAPHGAYGYGPPTGLGRPTYAPPGPAQLRHRPGVGLVVGLVGLAMLVASLAVLPWISVGGDDATLRDIGDAYSALDGLDVGEGGILTPPDVTVPDVSVPDVTLPDGSSPDDGLGTVVTPPATVDDTYTPPPSGDLEPFHELYAMGLCWAVAAWAALALVVAALWVPRGKGGRMGLGFVVGGLVGLVANALDERGRVGPRLTGALVAVVCLVAHSVAAMQIFGEEGAPDPAIGVWAGVAGLLMVVVGCAVGTRTVEEAPARW